MRFITFVLIVIVLLMIFFIPITQAIVDAESDRIVAIINNEQTGFASAWASAQREASHAFGENVTSKLLSKECVKYERVSAIAVRNNSGTWTVLFFLDSGFGYNAKESVVIDTFKFKGNNTIEFSGIICNVYNDVFSAFKGRLEREFE